MTFDKIVTEVFKEFSIKTDISAIRIFRNYCDSGTDYIRLETSLRGDSETEFFYNPENNALNILTFNKNLPKEKKILETLAKIGFESQITIFEKPIENRYPVSPSGQAEIEYKSYAQSTQRLANLKNIMENYWISKEREDRIEFRRQERIANRPWVEH